MTFSFGFGEFMEEMKGIVWDAKGEAPMVFKLEGTNLFGGRKNIEEELKRRFNISSSI